MKLRVKAIRPNQWIVQKKFLCFWCAYVIDWDNPDLMAMRFPTQEAARDAMTKKINQERAERKHISQAPVMYQFSKGV
jgi:hypothetical protein